jgi:poly(A) polymerase
MAYPFPVARPESYGVTPPISRDAPSAQEVIQATDLMKELRAQGTFEPEEDSRKR